MKNNKFNQFKGKSGNKFNQSKLNFKGASKGDKRSPNKSRNDQKNNQKRERNQNNNSECDKIKIIEENDSKKVHYVLNPKLLRRKIREVKEGEQRAREKSFLDKKRKRNAIYMKTNDRGQPKLNARMKLLYDQISRSCGKE